MPQKEKPCEVNLKRYILRAEFFGGLLIERYTMRKYQIPAADAYSLTLISRGISTQEAEGVTRTKFGVSYRFPVNEYVELGVLVPENGRMRTDVNFIGEDNDVLPESTGGVCYLRAPIELTIYPTYHCNLDCEFCFLGENKGRSVDALFPNQWCKIIGEFVDEGVVSLSILGGEPTLYRGINEILRYADGLGINVSMTSNGQSWGTKLIDEVSRLNHFTPIFSVKCMHDADGRLTQEFRKVQKIVQALLEHGVHSRINTVYTGQALNELEGLSLWCAENGIDKFSLALCYGNGDVPNITEFLDVGKELRLFLSKNHVELRFTYEGCMIFSAEKDLEGSCVNTPYQILQYGCECGNTILEIDPQGNAYPCAAYISQSRQIGNITDSNWKTIWRESDLLTQIRNEKCTDSDCMSCDCKHFCKGGCPALKQSLEPNTNPFLWKDPRCTRTSKKVGR